MTERGRRVSATDREVVGALEIGGTHVSAALVSLDERAIDPAGVQRDALAADGTGDELVRSIVTAARRLSRPDVTRWGIATPGPFDYARGVSRIRGVAKLDALYGADLRAELSAAVGVKPTAVSFINDASAFLIGEWWAGKAHGDGRSIGVTLGTGLGSAFSEDGAIVRSGDRVPPGGELYRLRFRGADVERTISRAALRAAYGTGLDDDVDVEQIAERAHAGEPAGGRVFDDLGTALGQFLTPWLRAFDPSCLVVGGSIARSWGLFERSLRAELEPVAGLRTVTVAEHIDDSALLGAAYYAASQT